MLLVETSSKTRTDELEATASTFPFCESESDVMLSLLVMMVVDDVVQFIPEGHIFDMKVTL